MNILSMHRKIFTATIALMLLALGGVTSNASAAVEKWYKFIVAHAHEEGNPNKAPLSAEEQEVLFNHISLLNRYSAECLGGKIQFQVVDFIDVAIPPGSPAKKYMRGKVEAHIEENNLDINANLFLMDRYGVVPNRSGNTVTLDDFTRASELVHENMHLIGVGHTGSIFFEQRDNFYEWDEYLQKYRVITNPVERGLYMPICIAGDSPGGAWGGIGPSVLGYGGRMDQLITFDKYKLGGLPVSTEFHASFSEAQSWTDQTKTIRLFAHDELTAEEAGSAGFGAKYYSASYDPAKYYAVTLPHNYIEYKGGKGWQDVVNGKLFIEYIRQPKGVKYKKDHTEFKETNGIRVFLNRSVIDPVISKWTKSSRSASMPFTFSDAPGHLVSQPEIGHYISRLRPRENTRFIPPPVRYAYQLGSHYFDIEVVEKGTEAASGYHYVDIKLTLHDTPVTPAQAGDLNRNLVDDEWEQKHFPDQTEIPFEEDSDGDGYSNMDEYIAGTDPHNRADYFTIRMQNKTISWEPQPNRLYNVYRRGDLADSGFDWSNAISGDFLTSPSNSFEITLHQYFRFFKVDVSLDFEPE